MKTYVLCLFCVCGLLGQTTAQSAKKRNKGRSTELGLNVTTTLAGFFNSGGETPIDPYVISFKKGKNNRFFRMGATFKVKNSLPLDFTTTLLTKDQNYNVRLGFERRIPITEHFRMHWGIDGIVEYVYSSTESRANNNTILLENRQIGGGGGPVLGVSYLINDKMNISTEAAIYGIYRQGSADLSGINGIERQNPKSFELSPMIPNSLYFNFSF